MKLLRQHRQQPRRAAAWREGRQLASAALVLLRSPKPSPLYPSPPPSPRGHASENPELPEALAARGIRFLGPPGAAMAALGDKIGSTILAQAAGVPTLPWSGSGVAVRRGKGQGDGGWAGRALGG